MPKIYPTAKISERTELELDETSLIHDFVLIICNKLVMGKGSQINSGARLVGRDEIIIGDHCVVGYNSVLIASTDTPEGEYTCDSMPLDKREVISGPIVMEDRSFLGSLCVVMPNVTLVKGTFIGANSFIWSGEKTKENGVYWGSPIKWQYERGKENEK